MRKKFYSFIFVRWALPQKEKTLTSFTNYEHLLALLMLSIWGTNDSVIWHYSQLLTRDGLLMLGSHRRVTTFLMYRETSMGSQLPLCCHEVVSLIRFSHIQSRKPTSNHCILKYHNECVTNLIQLRRSSIDLAVLGWGCPAVKQSSRDRQDISQVFTHTASTNSLCASKKLNGFIILLPRKKLLCWRERGKSIGHQDAYRWILRKTPQMKKIASFDWFRAS